MSLLTEGWDVHHQDDCSLFGRICWFPTGYLKTIYDVGSSQSSRLFFHMWTFQGLRWPPFKESIQVTLKKLDSSKYINVRVVDVSHSYRLHPWKLMWKLNMNPWKWRFLLGTIMFSFHVSVQGCKHRIYPLKSNMDTQNSHVWKKIHFPNNHFWYLC